MVSICLKNLFFGIKSIEQKLQARLRNFLPMPRYSENFAITLTMVMTKELMGGNGAKIHSARMAHFYTWPDGHVFVRSARRNGGLPDGAICRFCVATLRPRGCPPCAAYAAYPARPRKGDTRPGVCPPSEGLITEHRHPDRSPGTPRRTVIFYAHFQKKEANDHEQKIR